MRSIIGLAAALALVLASPIAARQDVSALTQAAPDREMMVPVEGGKVYVRLNGRIHAGGPIPVIFIHGGPGGTHTTFAPLLGLADERPVIFYDQLGSGKSDRPDDPALWRVERFVEELESVRQAIGAEKVHIVGHSWGAAIALEYAVKHPKHVVSTVLGGTFISATHWLTDANMLLREMSAEDRNLVKVCESGASLRPTECSAAFSKVYSRYYRTPERSEQLKRYTERYGGKGFNGSLYNHMWGPSEFASTGSLRNYDATLKLLEIDGRRTLFLIGQYDSARIDTVQEFVALTPGAEFAVVPGGAHGFITDRPEETEAILRGWLRRMDEK